MQFFICRPSQKKCIARLQYVQNSAARVLTSTRCSAHITPLLVDLHWLLASCIHLKLLLLTFKALNGFAPPYLADLLHPYCPACSLRSSELGFLSIPRFRLSTVGGRSFSAPKLWNSLPHTLHTIPSLSAFKSQLKHIYLICTLDNGYMLYMCLYCICVYIACVDVQNYLLYVKQPWAAERRYINKILCLFFFASAVEVSVQRAAFAEHLQPVHCPHSAAAVCSPLLQSGVPVQRGTEQKPTQVWMEIGYLSPHEWAEWDFPVSLQKNSAINLRKFW